MARPLAHSAQRADSVAPRRNYTYLGFYGILAALAVGLAALVIFAASATSFGGFARNVGVGLALAGAAALVGVLLGFLFGIPRSMQQQMPASAPEPSGGGEGESERAKTGVGYGANTNLEQISDWLTKILVGVGLTQLNAIPERFGELAAFVAPGYVEVAHANVVAVGLILHFLVCGFILSYLWTRLYLGTALREADLTAFGLLEQRVSETQRKLTELEQQSERDALALTLANRHLMPAADTPPVKVEELKTAILGASASARTTIFNQAWGVRSANWRGDKAKMERTIPIFEAVLKGAQRDGENPHVMHGQLGFALKDKASPSVEDLTRAEQELTEAMRLRGDPHREGWLFYEFARAECRIRLDQEKVGDQPSTAEAKNAIVQDLEIAIQAETVERAISNDPVIQAWMKRNKVHVPRISR